MRKVIFVLILLFISLNIVSAIESENISEYEIPICNKIYFFLIEHGSNYREFELYQFYNSLNTTLSQDRVTHYIDYYEYKCEDLINKKLPFQRYSINNLNLTINDTLNICKTEINKTILGDLFDLDTSLSFFRINLIGDKCQGIENFRWLFQIKEDDSGYYFSGIKLYIILFPSILFISFYIILDIRRTNSLIRRIVRNGKNI